MNKKKTETKLKNLEGMKGAIEGIVKQAWERGYKYGLYEAEQKHQVKVLIGGEQVYPKDDARTYCTCDTNRLPPVDRCSKAIKVEVNKVNPFDHRGITEV